MRAISDSGKKLWKECDLWYLIDPNARLFYTYIEKGVSSMYCH